MKSTSTSNRGGKEDGREARPPITEPDPNDPEFQLYITQLREIINEYKRETHGYRKSSR